MFKMTKFKNIITGEICGVVVENGKPVLLTSEKGVIKEVKRGGRKIGQLGDVEKKEVLAPEVLSSEYLPLCQKGVELLMEVCGLKTKQTKKK